MSKIIIPILLLWFWSCSTSENIVSDVVTTDGLTKVGEYNLQVPEPSGLALSFDKNHLWTVSDENGTVYKISKTGDVEDEIKVNGIWDFEGITVGAQSDLLWVVNEQLREAVRINLNGEIISKTKILDGDDNSGLEGICYRSDVNGFLLLKEKNPGLLIETDADFRILKQRELNFASDYSGMCVDTVNDVLVIVSDVSKSVSFCNTDGDEIRKYITGIDQVEGVAVDPQEKLLYLVSDQEEKLYVFRYAEE